LAEKNTDSQKYDAARYAAADRGSRRTNTVGPVTIRRDFHESAGHEGKPDDTQLEGTEVDMLSNILLGAVNPILSGELGSLFGTSIVVSEFLSGQNSKQVRFPRSKRKRIRKKWSKDPRNFALVREPQVFRVGETIVADPISYAEILKAVGRS